MVISLIVLYAGFTSFVESVKKIINPVMPEYSLKSLIFIALAVFAKIILGITVKRTGKKVNSDSLVASGVDALLDSVVSFSTLVAALIFVFTGKSLESYLALIISFVIIKSALEMLLETLSDILGKRIDSELSKEIKETICATDSEIAGAFDLTLNNYGPDRLMGSVHIEVPESWNAGRIDTAARKIQSAVYEKHSVILSAIGIYSVNTGNSKAQNIRESVQKILTNYPEIIQMHGFYADVEHKNISFDVVISFDVKDKKTLCTKIKKEVEYCFKDFFVHIQQDDDVSD